MKNGRGDTWCDRAREALERDPGLNGEAAGIRVRALERGIALEGEVSSSSARRSACGIVRGVLPGDGVLEDRLKVRGATAGVRPRQPGHGDGGDHPVPPAPPEQAEYGPDAFRGRSEAAGQVRALLERLSRVPFSALVISGETGTGKGLAVRILHHSGPRAHGPLVEVNCAALPRDLLESELFGHEAGAFTGARGRHHGFLEQAHGGTLFLDEVGEMDGALQAKLLKVIEDRRLQRVGGEKTLDVDVQVVVASNRDLQQAVREGRFRSDLYHRLSVLKLDLPPLRQRIEDLEDLVPALVTEFNAIGGRQVRRIPERVYERMRAWRWPGNVRELRNVVERCVLLAEGDEFPERWLNLGGWDGQDPEAGVAAEGGIAIPLDGSMALDEMDRFIIRTTLERHQFNVTRSAEALGTTRDTLRYRIQKYGLARGDGEAPGEGDPAPPA